MRSSEKSVCGKSGSLLIHDRGDDFRRLDGAQKDRKQKLSRNSRTRSSQYKTILIGALAYMMVGTVMGQPVQQGSGPELGRRTFLVDDWGKQIFNDGVNMIHQGPDSKEFQNNIEERSRGPFNIADPISWDTLVRN